MIAKDVSNTLGDWNLEVHRVKCPCKYDTDKCYDNISVCITYEPTVAGMLSQNFRISVTLTFNQMLSFGISNNTICSATSY